MGNRQKCTVQRGIRLERALSMMLPHTVLRLISGYEQTLYAAS